MKNIKKLKKIFIVMLTITLILSNISVSFGVSEKQIPYAESDAELIQAENLLNNNLIEFKEKSLIELNKLQNSKTIEKEKEKVKKLQNYKDLKGNIKFNEVIKSSQNVNADFIELCKEIEKYRVENLNTDTKEIVKHFNSLAGLKEKPKKNLVNLSFGNYVYALSYADWTKLTTAEKLLIASNPGNAIMTESCKQWAFSWTNEKFGYNGLGDKSDGYRHGVWNALMTGYISRAWAYSYATAHESKSQAELNKKAADGYYEWQHRNMDLHNNQVGRDQVAWYEYYGINLSASTIKSRISAKLTNQSSGIIWLHN